MHLSGLICTNVTVEVVTNVPSLISAEYRASNEIELQQLESANWEDETADRAHSPYSRFVMFHGALRQFGRSIAAASPAGLQGAKHLANRKETRCGTKTARRISCVREEIRILSQLL